MIRETLSGLVAGALFVACSAADPSPSPSPSSSADAAAAPPGTPDASADIGTRSPASCAPVTGVLRTAVLLVNAGDIPVTCSVAAVRNSFFGAEDGVSAFYRESSYGQLDVQGDVFGPVTIPAPATCVSAENAAATTDTLRVWYEQADKAAAAAGIDLSAFDRRVYVMPDTMVCGKQGGGVSRAQFKRAWVFRCNQNSVYAHEFGHVLGVNHASTPSSDYGDGSDIMGHGFVQPNGPHRAELGWLPPDRVVAVSKSGLYTIGMLETPQASPQVLVIPRRDDPARAIFLSFRQAVGFDTNLPGEFVGRTSVHEFAAACPAAAASGPPHTILVKTLGDGEAFADVAAGVAIIQTAHDAASASVQITFTGR